MLLCFLLSIQWCSVSLVNYLYLLFDAFDRPWPAVKDCSAEGPFCLTSLAGVRKLACAVTYPRPRGKEEHVTLLDQSHLRYQCALLVHTKEPEELITRFTVSSLPLLINKSPVKQHNV